MFPLTALAQPARPNIVLVLMDNLGWGELGTYGGGVLRGAPTPRIDALADEGLKLLNFNVEAQCTPSRAALMTGRYAIRTGNASIPLGVGEYGLTQWEYTMAEMLSDAGYATGMFGKWHLGDSPGRYPTDQGFDEWFGISNTTDESYWPDNDLFRPGVHPQAKYAYVMAAQRGETPKELEVYTSARRRTIDRVITDRAIAYMQRMAAGTKPFFLFVPYTLPHLPVEPHPDYKGKTGNGHWADVLAQTDAYVGELLDAVEKLGIKDNTIFIFTSDNGPEGVIPHQGFSGPWRGSYFTGLEGSLRAPFLIRWPGRIPAKRVSNDIVHEMDLFPTFARLAGGTVPGDRVIDGVEQTDFLTGTATKSNRESVVIYVGSELYGVKWRDWKMMVKEVNTIAGDPVRSYDIPLFYNLLLDPKEEHPVLYAAANLWVRYPAGQVLFEHAVSLKKEPPIPPGTPASYRPSR
jgi:arylsulfatase